MRYLILLALLSFGLSAQEWHIFGYEGPETVYRGKTSYFAIRGLWMTWRTVSSVSVGDPGVMTTSAPHGFSEGTNVFFKSTGTVPSPFPSESYVIMNANNVTSTTFEVNEVESYASLEILDAGSGTISVGTSGSGWTALTYSISGKPAGVTHEVWRHTGTLPWTSMGTADKGSLSPAQTNASVAFLALTVSETATLGAATITFNVITTTGTIPVTIPITVAAMPIFDVARPASATTVPMLNEFTLHMKAIAARNCIKSTGVIINPTSLAPVTLVYDSELGETQFGYYDGGWAMDQLAEFTGDEEYRNCGDTVAGGYRDWIMNDNSLPQHRVFPDGLARRMRETRDGRYRHALHRLVNGVGAYSNQGGNPGNALLRETAYALNAAVSEAEITGEPLNLYGQRAAEFIFGDLEQHFVNDIAPVSAVFQDALATQALIKYWGLTGDTRVPHMIKTTLDWWWDNAYEPVTGQFYYTAHPYGPRCFKRCKPELPDGYILTALIMPAYGWYYSVTGDTTYRDRGDHIFQRLPFHVMPTSIDTASDTFTLAGHGLVQGQAYTFVKSSSATGHLGGGVYDGYNGALYICNVTPNTYQIDGNSDCSSPTNIADDSDVRDWVVIRYGASVFDSGKASAQNMRWIMKYIRWRQLLD